jgi:VIT1/CCC1 family predicted Fe2+/Mn2+ transporter
MIGYELPDLSDPDSTSEVRVASRSEHAERRGESEEQRLDRNLMELLQELRVAIPGIQVLFAFLLVVPFQQGWAQVSDFETTVYYVTLLLTAISSICLIAPTARHRMRFRELDKRWIVETANRLAIVGLAFLAGAICGVLMLITHYLYDSTLTAVVVAAFASVFGWFWFVAPVVRDLREDD